MIVCPLRSVVSLNVFLLNRFCISLFIQVTHHHSHYSAAHPTHPSHGIVSSLVGAAPRGYAPPAGGVAGLHTAGPPPVHTDYTAHHQLSQQVQISWKNMS